MAVPAVKHNRGEKLNAESLRAAVRNRPTPHRLFIDPILIFEGVCFKDQIEAGGGALPRDRFENRVDRRPCGLGHPSLAIKRNWDHSLSFRLSGIDRRNNAAT